MKNKIYLACGTTYLICLGCKNRLTITKIEMLDYNEKVSFRYPAIETHKKKSNRSKWIVGGVLLTIIFVLAYLIFT